MKNATWILPLGIVGGLGVAAFAFKDTLFPGSEKVDDPAQASAQNPAFSYATNPSMAYANNPQAPSAMTSTPIFNMGSANYAGLTPAQPTPPAVPQVRKCELFKQYSDAIAPLKKELVIKAAELDTLVSEARPVAKLAAQADNTFCVLCGVRDSNDQKEIAWFVEYVQGKNDGYYETGHNITKAKEHGTRLTEMRDRYKRAQERIAELKTEIEPIENALNGLKAQGVFFGC